MLITKASGEKETFDRKKYEASLQRVGLTLPEAQAISKQINQDLYPSIPSSKIYLKTQIALRKTDKVIAARYSLKRAIMDLGPSGFFFERYMSAVLNAYGYKTKYNQFLKGKCVEHEVDIVAERDNKKYMIECKYHNSQGVKSDIKVALYVYARFLDLKDKYGFAEPVLVTNTLCTTEAIKYSRCMGFRIIGWHYPFGKDSLEYYIDSKKLYPVTALTQMTSYLNRRLREENIVMAKDLLKYNAVALAGKLNLKENAAQRLIAEARALCS